MKRFLFGLSAMIGTLVSCSTSNGVTLDEGTYSITELNGTAMHSDAEIIFKDGKINTSVGCNSIFASYKTGSNGSIEISGGGSTKMLCPDELREDEYVKALHQTVRFSVDNKTVSFYNSEDSMLFKAVRK